MFKEVGEDFRKSTFCYLGVWHVYKMASTCVWRMFAADFIAPLFHQFFPNTPFPWSPRLVLSTRIFSLMRLAYPTFREQLDATINKEALTEIQKNHLLNLRSIFQWFIPKVLNLSLHCLCHPSILFCIYFSSSWPDNNTRTMTTLPFISHSNFVIYFDTFHIFINQQL